MKKFSKITKNIFAAAVAAAILLVPFCQGFAAEEEEGSKKEVLEVLARVNAEFGTEIALADENAPVKLMTQEELDELEATMRYMAEFEIPKMRETTARAMEDIAAAEAYGEKCSIDGIDSFESVDAERIDAMQEINYAYAALSAYYSYNTAGKPVWGDVISKGSIANTAYNIIYEADRITITSMDARRTLLWTGEGWYYLVVDGQLYSMQSGSQTSYFYISTYVN